MSSHSVGHNAFFFKANGWYYREEVHARVTPSESELMTCNANLSNLNELSVERPLPHQPKQSS